MTKQFIPVAFMAGAFIAAMAAAPKNDPVLMTVNGKDVPLSEFMYLYEKNNQQQQYKQTVDEYLDLFVNYKLKVADAEAAGVDTTKAFKDEFTTYVRDLSAPYLKVASAEDEVINMLYNRMKTNRDVSHILLPLAMMPNEQEALDARMDSIYNALINGADWGELAVKYSIDPTVENNKGHLGWVTANMWPIKFEDAIYKMKVGEISKPVKDFPYGYHIIKVAGERPDQGKVHVAHILKLTNGSNDAEMKAVADSLYTLAINGADFAQLAADNSDDRGSKAKGGDVGYFGPGRMVPEFEKISFELGDGEISKPFKTSYGYHIVKRIDAKGLGTVEEEAPAIKQIIARDPDRTKLVTDIENKYYVDKYKGKLDEKGLKKVEKLIREMGGITVNEGYDRLVNSGIKIGKLNGKNLTIADVVATIPRVRGMSEADGINFMNTRAKDMLAVEAKKLERTNLENTNPEYRNLVNEYRDGIMLFEVSSENVWDKASKDKDGLQTYFETNRSKYKWDTPHYKGYIVMATNDSIAEVAKTYLSTHKVEADSLQSTLKREFDGKVRADKVVAAKGDNAIVDYVVFEGEKPSNGKSPWISWFSYEGRMIEAPEEAVDARAAVTSDYQQYLENEWVKQLREKYPVVINQEVLKDVKNKQ